MKREDDCLNGLLCRARRRKSRMVTSDIHHLKTSCAYVNPVPSPSVAALKSTVEKREENN